MYDLLIFTFVYVTVVASLLLALLFKYIRDIWRYSSFGENKMGCLIALMICIYFGSQHQLYWESSVDLDDLQFAKGTLKSRISLDIPDSRDLDIRDSYFTLSGRGVNNGYWDFSRCGSAGDVILNCKGKPLTIWHKDRIVYQVETDEEVIYSIFRSNIRIFIANLTNLIGYIFIIYYIPIAYFAVGPYVEELREIRRR